MAKAAVPNYLGEDFDDTPPGHRFTLYGAFWEPDKGWERVKNIDPVDLKRNFDRLPASASKLRDALRARQLNVALILGNTVLTLEAKSTAPFVTGTGIEHPLENGMAFLNPYGLPYLPGSSVKGVLRRAAEELRDEVFDKGSQGWDRPTIDALFGKEPESGDTETERTRGALIFWDVFPKCDRLAVDIMNPHFGEYYQGKGNTTPHDSGQPKPIFFLTIPPNSQFTFHVQCNIAALSEKVHESWKELLQAAFEHAFNWLGFGAKTAVGYGQMREDVSARQQHQKLLEQQVAERALEAQNEHLSPLERSIQEILKNRPNPNEPSSTTLVQALERGQWQGEEAVLVAHHIQRVMQDEKKWKPTSSKPKKDKDHQRTLKVLAYLEGQSP